MKIGLLHGKYVMDRRRAFVCTLFRTSSKFPFKDSRSEGRVKRKDRRQTVNALSAPSCSSFLDKLWSICEWPITISRFGSPTKERKTRQRSKRQPCQKLSDNPYIGMSYFHFGLINSSFVYSFPYVKVDV